MSSGTLFGQDITISCNEGYNLTGSSLWTCGDTGWNETATCEIQGMVKSALARMFYLESVAIELLLLDDVVWKYSVTTYCLKLNIFVYICFELVLFDNE